MAESDQTQNNPNLAPGTDNLQPDPEQAPPDLPVNQEPQEETAVPERPGSDKTAFGKNNSQPNSGDNSLGKTPEAKKDKPVAQAQEAGPVPNQMRAFWLQVKSWLGALPTIDDVFTWILKGLGFRLKPEKILRRANNLAQRKLWPEAIASYHEVLSLRPLNIIAYDGLGRAYYNAGLLEEANTEFAVADSLEHLLKNRDDLSSAATLAESMVKRESPMQAVTLVEPILVAHFFSHDNLQLLKAMAKAYRAVHHEKKESQVYEAGLSQHPGEPFFYIAKGEQDIRNGHRAEGERLLALGRLLTRMQEEPKDPSAFMTLGELYIKEGRLDDGLALLARAALIDTANTGLRWRLFKLYQKQRDTEMSLKYLLEISELKADDEETQYRLAEFYCKNAQPEKAQEIYDKFIKKTPMDPRPYAGLGALLIEIGQTDKGQEFMELAKTLECGLKPNPDHKETARFMKFLFSSGRAKEGNEWLERGLEKWPYNGEFILTKAKQLYGEKLFKDAMLLIKRLLSIKSDSAEAHMWLALCHQGLGEQMAALSEAQLATRLAPRSFTAHKILGDILKEQKKFSPAHAAYEAASLLKLGYSKNSPSLNE